MYYLESASLKSESTPCITLMLPYVTSSKTEQLYFDADPSSRALFRQYCHDTWPNPYSDNSIWCYLSPGTWTLRGLFLGNSIVRVDLLTKYPKSCGLILEGIQFTFVRSLRVLDEVYLLRLTQSTPLHTSMFNVTDTAMVSLNTHGNNDAYSVCLPITMCQRNVPIVNFKKSSSCYSGTLP